MDYRQSGVDIDAGNALVERIKPIVKATDRAGTLGSLGGFAALFDLKSAGFHDPILVSGTDGVGTKLKIAIDTGLHDNIGIDLVAMCVNDVIVQGAEPLFFLDYFATGRLDVGVAERIIKGIAIGCKRAGCALIGGETAEMPRMYSGDDYDLAGFCVGAVERDQLLPKDISAGDHLIGLQSSGLHSNGYSLVHAIMEQTGTQWQDVTPWREISFSKEFLKPTKIYVQTILALRKAGILHGAAHITGGGLIENLPRVIPQGLRVAFKTLATWYVPPIFTWLRENGDLSLAEMLRTFNCGIGMVVIVPDNHIVEAYETILRTGDRPHYLGRVETGDEHHIVLPAMDHWVPAKRE